MGWPTTNDPKTELVTLRLTVGQAADLDLHARASGAKRSEYVRDAVEEKIARDKKRAAKKTRSGGQVGGTS